MRQSKDEIIEMYLRAELYERLDCYEKLEDIYIDLLSYSDPYEFENGFCYGVSLLLSVMEKEKEFNKNWKERRNISNE